MNKREAGIDKQIPFAGGEYSSHQPLSGCRKAPHNSPKILTRKERGRNRQPGETRTWSGDLEQSGLS